MGKRTIMKFLNQLKLNEVYIYSGENFKEELSRSKNWYSGSIGKYKFYASPLASAGVLSINGTNSFPIKIFMESCELTGGEQRIEIRTKLRAEHYFIVLLFVVFMIAIPFLEEFSWWFLLLLPIWVICHIWFHFICRVQEEMLVKKIVKQLRLKRIA